MSYDEQLDEVGIYPVTAKWSHLDPVVVKLVIDGELILTTPEHPFFISGDAWVAAGELWLGAQVQKADGNYGAVEVIEVVSRPQEMYNLTVSEAQTYFVGSEQWLVHNACRFRGAAGKDVYNRLKDGHSLTTDEILDAGEAFLGDNPLEIAPGVFVSRNPIEGTDRYAMYRITDSDITGTHGGGPHANFQVVQRVVGPTGRVTYKPRGNKHIYIVP